MWTWGGWWGNTIQPIMATDTNACGNPIWVTYQDPWLLSKVSHWKLVYPGGLGPDAENQLVCVSWFSIPFYTFCPKVQFPWAKGAIDCFPLWAWLAAWHGSWGWGAGGFPVNQQLTARCPPGEHSLLICLQRVGCGWGRLRGGEGSGRGVRVRVCWGTVRLLVATLWSPRRGDPRAT